MAQAFGGVASDVEQLSERVNELERRICALEGKAGKATAASDSVVSIAPPKLLAPEPLQEFLAPNSSTGTLPVIGKAVLGIAGAYLLRAVAESGSIPKFPMLMAAIVYAGMWLVWAARTRATNRFASVAYAITSALILSPLLWESTVRFQVLPAVFTAVVLVTFIVLSLTLAWRQNLQVIPWVATVAVVVTAVALLIATRELVVFTVALLAVGLAAEVATAVKHVAGLRVIPALAADLAVWVLIYVMTAPEGAPAEYPPVGAVTISVLGATLLVIYGGSIGWSSLGLGKRLTVFEIGQSAVAFGLATFGIMRASPGAAGALGVFFMLVAQGCYWGALSRFTGQEQAFNRRVYATYAVALLLAGCLLALPVSLQPPFLCLAAATSAFIYTRTGKRSLGVHVSYYLAGAAILSGLVKLTGNALAGSVPRGLDSGTWVVAVSAGVCCAIGLRKRASQSQSSESQWKEGLLWIVPCVLVAGVAAAIAVMASVRLGAGMLNASRLSVVRTVVICGVALVLGYAGSRWKRVELLWAAYVAIGLGTLKLVFEDLRYGNALSLMASLLFYGMILIVIPRLTRRGSESS